MITQNQLILHFFPSDEREKTGVLRGYFGVKSPNHILGLGPGPRT